MTAVTSGMIGIIGYCSLSTVHASSVLSELPLHVSAGVPYLEGLKLGMHVKEVKQILVKAGYHAHSRGVLLEYKKGNAVIQVGRNPDIPLKSIKYQLAGEFDLKNVDLNYRQKKRYIDQFQSLFPKNTTCRLQKNVNAHAFCKYQVMQLGKLKYRVVLEIKNTGVQLKYSGG